MVFKRVHNFVLVHQTPGTCNVLLLLLAWLVLIRVSGFNGRCWVLLAPPALLKCLGCSCVHQAQGVKLGQLN